jgi:MinD-like ATPase involved in chromosome partitioning or flagellar assembly
MKIISFYSFKGGVGRSLCLLNVAYQLSHRWGHRIGLVDLDIEAGGLAQILNLEVNGDNHLLKLLIPQRPDPSDLEQFILPASFEREGAGRVFLLPTVSDSKLLDDVHWDVAAQHFLQDEIFREFARVYNLDFLLLDSRSGLSEFSTFALKVADLEVLVCRLDKQNRFGMKRIIDVCRAAQKPFKVVVSACPKQGRHEAVDRFARAIESEIDCVLPYEPRLYYDEFIISKEHKRHELTKLYTSLAEEIRAATQTQ